MVSSFWSKYYFSISFRNAVEESEINGDGGFKMIMGDDP